MKNGNAEKLLLVFLVFLVFFAVTTVLLPEILLRFN